MKFIYTTGRITEDTNVTHGSIISTKRVEGDFKIGVDIIVKNKLLCNVCIGKMTPEKNGVECFARYKEKDYKEKPFAFITGKWHGSYFNSKAKEDYRTNYEEFNKIVDELGCPEETKKLFLNLVNCMKTKEKIGLYDARYGDEAYDETGDFVAWSEVKEKDKYDEITPKTPEEKRKYYNEHNIFTDDLWDKEVMCMHCGKTFLFNDFKVVREKPEWCEDRNEYIVCKHYPKCNGSFIDMMPEDDEEEDK